MEGNLAFAAGVQEMLLQSHTGLVSVFPAIPAEWDKASFKKLRTVRAFLLSADFDKSQGITVPYYLEKGGKLRLQIPNGGTYDSKGDSDHIKNNNGILTVDTRSSETLEFVFKYSSYENY